jgi:hypothetical protein
MDLGFDLVDARGSHLSQFCGTLDCDAEGGQATHAGDRADRFLSPTTSSRLTALKTPRSSWMATRTDTKFNNLDMT